MSGPRLVAVAVAACSVVLATRAQAQDVRWQGQGLVQLGVTDNVAQAPDNPEPDQPQREADGLMVLAPTLALIIETTDASHTIAYGFGATLYFNNSEANSYSNGLSYVSRYTLTTTTDLALGVAGAYTQTNAFNLLGGANQTDVGLLPAEPVEVISVTVFEGVEHAIDENWSVNQTASGTALFTIGQVTRNYLLAAGVGATRGYEYHSFGANLGGEFLFTPDAEDDAGNQILGNGSVILRLTGSWSYELNDYFSSTLTAGGLFAQSVFGPDVDEDGDPIEPAPIIQPYGFAGIDYNDEIGTAGISIEHNVTPNVLTGSAQLTDTATLRAGIPLGRDSGFSISGTGSIGTARLVRRDGTFGPPLAVYVADGGVSYAVPAFPELAFDLRYQFTKQALLDPEAELDPEEGLQETHRHTGLFGISFTYPPLVEEQAGETPVFRPTPAASGDILGGVRDAREAAEKAEEIQEKRERQREKESGDDGSGVSPGVRGDGGDEE